MTLYEMDKILKKYETNEMDKEETEDNKIRNLVPEKYHEFLPLFKQAVAEVLSLKKKSHVKRHSLQHQY